MYFRCLATDISGVARRTQTFSGSLASNRLWNLVRRWFPAAFPSAGAAQNLPVLSRAASGNRKAWASA